jgi:hypothetical protein
MPIQQFVYRQLMYLVVIESILSAIRGTRLRWRPIARSGEVRSPTGAGAVDAGQGLAVAPAGEPATVRTERERDRIVERHSVTLGPDDFGL